MTTIQSNKTFKDRRLEEFEELRTTSMEEPLVISDEEAEILREFLSETIDMAEKREKGDIEQAMVHLFKELSNQKTIRMSRKTVDWLWGSMCNWINEYIENLSITNKEKQND